MVMVGRGDARWGGGGTASSDCVWAALVRGYLEAERVTPRYLRAVYGGVLESSYLPPLSGFPGFPMSAPPLGGTPREEFKSAVCHERNSLHREIVCTVGISA